ncbi:uncharacterized protein LOC110456414 [Mizuhopecten yessoensis]|uniref:uncharacterized protein LOC110456414 n=1 Tax=Mizuhopecten yessoensis TaxID=6573 RepID=UPI000B45A417|nr:uncharacterized protein LOC110456414 [Mizuhopecten yessoensis]
MEDALHIVPMKEIERCIQDFVPEQLRKNTSWTVNTWNTWAEVRNAVTGFGQAIIPTVQQFGSVQPQILDGFLCKFVMEVRNKDGNRYPKDSLHNLCAGISRFVRLVLKRPDLNFLDSKNLNFHHFQLTLRSQMKLSEDMGIKTDKKQSQPISQDQERILWKRRILNMDTALGLSRSVYYYNCKVFGVRAREEHRNLRVEQYMFGTDNEGKYIVFHGNSSKGSGHDRRKIRSVKHHDIDRDISVYKIFVRYIQAIGPSGNFYLKPLEPHRHGNIRFSVQPLGQNTLGSYTSSMMKDAGFEGHYTGHSGIVTLAVTLYSEGISERVIKERTGLLSEYVRHFKAMSTLGQGRRGELTELSSIGNGHISCENNIQLTQDSTSSPVCKLKNLTELPSLYTGQQRQANMVRLYQKKHMQDKDISRIIDVPDLSTLNVPSDTHRNVFGGRKIFRCESENLDENFPYNYGHSSGLESSWSSLETMPDDLIDVTNMTGQKVYLDCNGNKIGTITEGLEDLHSYQILNVSASSSENISSELVPLARPMHKRKPSVPHRIVGSRIGDTTDSHNGVDTSQPVKKMKTEPRFCDHPSVTLVKVGLNQCVQTTPAILVSTATQTGSDLCNHVHKKLQYKVYHGMS